MKTMAALPMDSSDELTHLWVDFEGQVASVSQDDDEPRPWDPGNVATFVVVFVPLKYPRGLSDGWGFCCRDQPEFNRPWTILFRDSELLGVRGPLHAAGIWMERERQEIHVRFSVRAETAARSEVNNNLAIKPADSLVTACDVARAWQSWVGHIDLLYRQQAKRVHAHPFDGEILHSIGECLRNDIANCLPNRQLSDLVSVYADLLEDAGDHDCENWRRPFRRWLRLFGGEAEPIA